MARANAVKKFSLYYQTMFKTNIVGHHICKNIQTPKLNEIMRAKHDTRREAAEFDEHAIGIYNSNEILVGHAPVEFSLLLYYFLQDENHNFLTVEVLGNRKDEVGLVQPVKFIAFTKKKKNVFTQEKELKNRQEKLKLLFTENDTLKTVSHFESSNKNV